MSSKVRLTSVSVNTQFPSLGRKRDYAGNQTEMLSLSLHSCLYSLSDVIGSLQRKSGLSEATESHHRAWQRPSALTPHMLCVRSELMCRMEGNRIHDGVEFLNCRISALSCNSSPSLNNSFYLAESN